MNDATQDSAGPIRRFVALVLIVIGILWMAASGLCSAAFFIGLLVDNADFREVLSILPMIALVGGFSAGIGLVLFAVGRALRPPRAAG